MENEKSNELCIHLETEVLEFLDSLGKKIGKSREEYVTQHLTNLYKDYVDTDWGIKDWYDMDWSAMNLSTQAGRRRLVQIASLKLFLQLTKELMSRQSQTDAIKTVMAFGMTEEDIIEAIHGIVEERDLLKLD